VPLKIVSSTGGPAYVVQLPPSTRYCVFMMPAPVPSPAVSATLAAPPGSGAIDAVVVGACGSTASETDFVASRLPSSSIDRY
jgi:hypothetical protein